MSKKEWDRQRPPDVILKVVTEPKSKKGGRDRRLMITVVSSNDGTPDVQGVLDQLESLKPRNQRLPKTRRRYH